MKTLLSLLVALALVSSAPAHSAAPPPSQGSAAPSTPAPNWYNVEVIVFRLLDPKAGGQETWPPDPGEPDWKGAVALNTPDSVGPAVPYQALSPVNEQLDDEWNRLKRSHSYQALLHITWTQPATDRATASAVRLGVPPSAVPVPGTAVAAAVAIPQTSPSTPGSSPAPLVATPAYGTAKLSTTGPYLHFDLDLAYRGAPLSTAPTATTVRATMTPAPAAATSAAAAAFQLYRLDQDRRIDAGKLSYFDHPLFGAIVLVTPVRKP